ncbi:MAG: VWA domain-containing protein [Bacilli bacterium]|nr:VWA domain-containing protein [Bacilli bacterium]
MSNINFVNPWLLIIGIPLLLIVIGSFIYTVRKENRTIHNTLSFVIHIVVVLLVTLGLAKTTFEKVITETNIYVLADVSYSSNQNLDLIDKYIDDLENNVPKNSKIGIVCFGRDYEILSNIGEELKSVKNSNVDKSATNIVEAIEYTATLFDDNVIKRIVIISDGYETKESNVVSLVQNLSAENIYIDAIFLDNNIKDDVVEVQINQVDFISSTYVETEEDVYTIIESNTEERAFVSLYKDNVLIREKAVQLVKGYNSVTFELDTSVAGEFNYEIKVSVENDTSEYNNSAIFNQTVTEKVKMLFISNDIADKEAALELYGDSYDIDFRINNKNIPYTVEELSVYDEYVISNIDIRTLNNASQFVASIDTLVSKFGKSLITFGNTYIQNNYKDGTLAVLNNMLPVKYGNDNDSDKLVTICMDISRSMEQVDRLNIAKATACSILDNLDDDVMVMLIGFYGEVRTVFQQAQAKERETLKQKITNLEAYQGTFMGSALSYTYEMVTSLPYSKNEVILISDGLPYGEQAASAKSIVKKMASNNIMLSTIHTISNEGGELMKELATLGKGYYYYIKDLEQVESLVLNGVMNSLTEVILESSESTVEILLKKDDLVDGIENLPNVKGLYNNQKKSSSKVVLEATYTDVAGNSYKIPLYTYWNYGNGMVSSFASTISGNWISNWETDTNGQKTLSNVPVANKPNERISSAFIFDTINKGTNTELIVNAPSLNVNSILNAKIITPSNKSIEKTLVFDSENYITTIETMEKGTYLVELTYQFGEKIYVSNYKFTVSYLPEYDAFTIFEASSLYYMVSNNGQVSENGILKLVNDNSNEQKYIYDFTALFMIISAVLLIVDVIVRKLTMNDIKALFRKKDYFQTGGNKNEKNN